MGARPRDLSFFFSHDWAFDVKRVFAFVLINHWLILFFSLNMLGHRNHFDFNFVTLVNRGLVKRGLHFFCLLRL